MGKYVRSRGLNFERECAKQLRRVFPRAKRHMENQAQEALGFDLDCTGPFRFQCKRNKKYAPMSKIEEVQDLHETIPALITQGDRKRPMVALYLEDFIKVLNDVGEAFVGEPREPDEITGDMF